MIIRSIIDGKELNEEQKKFSEMLLRVSTKGIPVVARLTEADLGEEVVVLNADCSVAELTGHYNEMNEYAKPKWLDELEEIEYEGKRPVLMIKDFDKIELKEHSKFNEILKYKKISTFDLPENCVVILSWNSHRPIEIYEGTMPYVAFSN